MEFKINTRKWIAWSMTLLVIPLITLTVSPVKDLWKRKRIAQRLLDQPKNWTAPNVAVRVGLTGGPAWVPASQYGRLTAVTEDGKTIVIPANMKIVEGIDTKSHDRYLWGQKEDGTTISLTFPDW